MRDYKDLQVWQKGMDVASATYTVTRTLPREERFGLVAQMRRASVSMPSNVAEGSGRKSDRDFARFLRLAFASSSELQTQVLLCRRLGMGDDELLSRLNEHIVEFQKMASGLIAAILESGRRADAS